MFSKCTVLGEVLSMKRLSVPAYQRRYCWSDSEIYRYINDLMTTPTGQSKYFGHIIIHQDDETNYIVDGQQRIVTSSLILLAAGEPSPELIPHVLDRNGFDDILAGLTEVSCLPFEKIRQLMWEKPDRVQHCVDVLKNAQVTLTVLSEGDDAAGVLESLNSTGQKMSDSDLVRGMDFLRQPSGLDELAYGELWRVFDEVAAKFSLTGDELMTRSMLATGCIPNIKCIESMGLFRAYLSSNVQQLNFSQIVSAYCQKVMDIDEHKFSPAFSSLMSCMRQFKLVSLEFLLINTAIKVCDKKITEEQAYSFLATVNSYCVRALLAGVKAEEISENIAGIGDIEAAAFQLFYADPIISPMIAQPFSSLVEKSGVLAYDIIEYLLKCFEIKLHRKEISFENTSICRIVPRQADSSWHDLFGGEREYLKYIDCFDDSIVNYALVEDSLEFDNSSMGMAIKKLTKSAWSLTRAWGKQKDISEKAMCARRDAMWSLAEKLFCVPKVPTEFLLTTSEDGYLSIYSIQRTTGLKAVGVRVGSEDISGEEFKLRFKKWGSICYYILAKMFAENSELTECFKEASRSGAFTSKGNVFASHLKTAGLLEITPEVFVSLPAQGQACIKRTCQILQTVGCNADIRLKLTK